MQKNREWTLEEDKILYDNILKFYPHVSSAIEICSKLFNKTKGGIKNRISNKIYSEHPDLRVRIIHNNNKWTLKEENILKAIITKHTSAKQAFEEAGEILNRSSSSCQNRFIILKRKGFKYSFKKDFEKEAKILAEEISKTPDNLTEAFENTASKIGWTTGSVSAYYYGVDKNNPMYKENLATCFLLYSEEVTLSMIKNRIRKNK